MLTIHSGINQNYQLNPAFGRGNKDRNAKSREDENMSEMDKLTREYAEEREIWVSQKREFEEMIRDKESQIPKPLKTTMKAGAVLAAGVLGGMATGWSAKYIMNTFQNMYKSKPIQKAVTKFSENIAAPTKKGFKAVKKFISTQLEKITKSESYKTNKTKVKNKISAFKDTKFAKSLKIFGQKIADNKYVKKVTSAIDYVFSGIAEGVVKLYNKIAGINYKNAAADTLGVAGGISTGAVTLMDEVKKTEDGEGED